MKQSEILLIDAGNSRIKVSSLANPATIIFNTASNSAFHEWLQHQTCRAVWLASVRRDAAFHDVITHLNEKQITVHTIETESNALGLKNAYEDVSTMGVDRWLAMLAVAEKTDLPFAVLMFGTAITCDIVNEGKHVGGWIIPGRQLMQDALTQNTARVFADNRMVEQLALGQSTPECVGYGCFAAALGAVEMAKMVLRRKFQQYCIFLTGGDDKVLTSVKGSGILRAENLVLQGLARYAQQGELSKK
ncbi:type III pantothenate kinase [Alteromonas sediminis]|uniref:Type III pantothenate kinase n=1 Tax=Alteromonas sediminis TaxID=2259342 RepID=A0A3N5Y3H8_9ALTE|nr:type III pantothenate kinase [Alteromonas sediminis]RPJ67860.1 type III pantothenate kinase [Alteromonas sediminis]